MAVSFASPSFRAASSDLTIAISPLGLVELSDEEFEVHGPRLNRYAHHMAMYLGLHWAYRREMGESQLTFNYVRALSDFATSFVFSKGISFKTPDATSAIIPYLLQRIWEVDNRKPNLLWEMGSTGSVTGDCFVKVAYEEAYIDPAGMRHPGRVRLIPLNPSFCFPEWKPHDRDRMERFKLKYRFWACVDPETEALTRRGWLKKDELVAGQDQILVLDPVSDEIKWETVQEVRSYQYSGEMHKWSGKVDALTTPNHRWLAETHHGNQNNSRWEREIVFSGLRPERGRLVTGGGTPLAFADQAKWADELVETVGWYVTEGLDHWNQQNFHTIRISQHQDSKHIGEIRRLAVWWREQGMTCNEWRPSKLGMVDFYFGKGSNRLLEEVSPEKQLTPEFLCSLTAAQARLLYEVLMNGDGHRSHGQEKWTQVDLGRVAGFQMLCAMLGRRSRYSHLKATVYDSRYSSIEKLREEIVDYDGEVWCPSVPNTTIWFARRGGTTYWTGNTGANGMRQVMTYTELISETQIEEYVNDQLISSRPNPLGEIPVVHIRNLPVSGSPWGLADVQDLIPLNREYNEKATDISDIINYHAAPTTVITGARASNLEKGTKKVWSIPSEKARISNLELDPVGIEKSIEFLQVLKEAMHEMIGVPVGALGQAQPISNTSGVALAIQYMPVEMRRHLKVVQYGQGIERINALALRTLLMKEPELRVWNPEIMAQEPDEDALRMLDPADPSTYRSEVQFQAALPVDKLVKLNELQLLMALGLESKKGALEELGEAFPAEKLTELFEELLADAERQAALDYLTSMASAGIAAITGMVPGASGSPPVPVPPPPASGGGGSESAPAGGEGVTSAMGGVPQQGPLAGMDITDPEDQRKMFQRIVEMAHSAKMPRFQNPTNSQD